jgi:phosphoribosylglycinamide formyltransferase-1
MSDRGRVGILISGRGSNMVALLDAMEAGRIMADPAVVVSNRTNAKGLEIAAGRGVATEVLSHRKIRPREAHERQVIECLRRHRVDLVCLAGYMRLLSPLMVQAFPGRMLNIHPSLLPAFPGLDAQTQALEYGVKLAGCSVHFVDEECDHGPVVLQATVPVFDDDTEASLSARILVEEHRIYSEAVALFFEGRLTVEGRRVRIAATARSG